MADTGQQENDVKLRLAGVSYMLGDAAMATAGHIRGKSDVVSGAATWFAGGVGAALYGNPDKDMQLRILANRLERHLDQKGIRIPADTKERSELLKDRNFWDSFNEFMFEHPSEVLNGAYALGAGMLLHDGIKDIGGKNLSVLPKGFSKEALGKVSTNFWMGAIIMAGALAGLLIKEDPNAQEKAKNGNIVDKAVAFVTEKPLRVSGALYTVNNGFLALQLAQDWNARSTTYGAKNIKPHYFSALQLACYLFSNAMLLMSPRDQVSKGGFSTEDVAKLEEAAAQIIMAQPRETQEMLVKDMSVFMSQQAGVNQSAEQIEAQLKSRLHVVSTQSPAERRFATRLAQRELAEQANSQAL